MSKFTYKSDTLIGCHTIVFSN